MPPLRLGRLARHALLVLAALVLPSLVTGAVAHAGGPPGLAEPTVTEPAPATHTVRYGYQTFLADALWVGGSAILARSDGGGGGGELLALGYYGGGPLVHLLHHNQAAALKSVGLRVLLPVAGAVAGLVIASGRDDPDGFEAMGDVLIGFAGGAVAAMVIDWTVLSKHEVSVPHLGTVAAVRPGMKIGKRAVSISIAGSF
jgi:hypothetical protein